MGILLRYRQGLCLTEPPQLYRTLSAIAMACLTSWAIAADDLQQKSRELEQVKARIEQLSSQFSSVKGEFQQQSNDLQQTEKQIGKIARRIRVMTEHDGNMLLNIGPTGEGRISPSAVKRLLAVRALMDAHP